MDFLVIVGEDSITTSQFNDAFAFISEQMAHWNNFTPENPLIIEVRKIPSKTPVVNVSVDEIVDIKDAFGRP